MSDKSKLPKANAEFVLELVRGEDEQGKPVFAYLLLKENELEEFRAALDEGDIDLGEYGLIMETGEGHEPPAGKEAEIIASLKKKPA